MLGTERTGLGDNGQGMPAQGQPHGHAAFNLGHKLYAVNTGAGHEHGGRFASGGHKTARSLKNAMQGCRKTAGEAAALGDVRIVNLDNFRHNGHIDPDLHDVFVNSEIYRKYAAEFLDSKQVDC